MSNLFIACFPTGLVYCDKSREVDGDYIKVAYLNYGTLDLSVYEPRSPLMPDVKADAEQMQSRSGEQFQIAGNAFVTLGDKMEARP